MYPKFMRSKDLRGQVIPARWHMVRALCHLSKSDDTLELSTIISSYFLTWYKVYTKLVLTCEFFVYLSN
jgi:hypothetical protein